MTTLCTIKRPHYTAPTRTEFEVVKENAFTLEVRRAEVGRHEWNPVFTIARADVWLEWQLDETGGLVVEVDREELEQADNRYPGAN